MIVCQYSFGETDAQLALTEDIHRSHCKNLGYDYFVQRSPIDLNRGHYWQKPLMIKRLFEEGHRSVVYLDADTFWVGKPLNPDFDRIGAVFCDHIESHLRHHNAGVLYLNGDVSDILNLWLNEPDDGHYWGDNWSLKKLHDRNAIKIDTVPYKWNSFYYHPLFRDLENAVVHAWHGTANRAEKMKFFIDSYLRNHG